MIHTIPSADRFHTDMGWLSARWHFSFGHYHDPSNVHWGALRVFNDDVIQPGQGFPMHPHRDMEIITVVLEGELEHTDNLGSKGVIRPGEVQVMSAGSGIVHAERNPSPDTPLRLMQIWIFPREKGRKPRWEQRAFPDRNGKLLPVVAPEAVNGAIPIDQDATIYLSRLEAGQTVQHSLPSGKKGYLFVMEGAVELNGKKLQAGDQARIEDEQVLGFKAVHPSHFLYMDIPE